MLNNIVIGLTATLDLHTRTLTRRSDGKNVILPASACLCLQAMVEAQGKVLSSEQLMDIGWRSVGVEVTENSVRVMINKLRRALNQLELQNDITLLAVTRSGYRLIVREVTAPEQQASVVPAPPVSQPVAPPPSPTPAPILAKKAPVPKPRKWRKHIKATLAGLIAGLILGVPLYYNFILVPDEVDFIPWTGNGIPPHTEVRVQKNRQDQQTLIETTLKIYTEHVLDKRPTEVPAKVLYITLSSGRTKNHLGLIACQQPLQDSKNDCESFYFRVY